MKRRPPSPIPLPARLANAAIELVEASRAATAVEDLEATNAAHARWVAADADFKAVVDEVIKERKRSAKREARLRELEEERDEIEGEIRRVRRE